MTVEIPRVPCPREVLGCYPSTPTTAPPPARPGPEGRRVSGRVGHEPGSPRRRGQAARSSRGIPAEQWRAGGGWETVTGVPVSGVPTAPVKCSDLPLLASTAPGQRGTIHGEIPALHGPDPTRDPSTGTPNSGLRDRGSSTSFVNSPLPPGLPSGSPGTARPLPSTAFPPPTPNREPGPHLCTPSLPPPPLARSLGLCRRRSEPHTHRYTQPSDVTELSARPRHCGDTRLPADAAAVSVRPGESEGGGEGEGRGKQPAAAPRTRTSRRRCGRSLAAPSPSETRAPSGLLWLLGAPPRPVVSRAPSPPGARPALLAPRAVWAAGARRCLRCTRRRQDVPSPPHPHRRLPPSFLESPSRLSGATTAPPPPHPLLSGDGPDPGAPWPVGRRATGREGAGRPRGALCATPAAGRAEAEPARRALPPEVRHGRPSPREAAAGPPRPGGSRVAAALQQPPPPPCGPRSQGRAGAAPPTPPREASRLRAAPPAACAPPQGRTASAQTPSPG